MRECTEVITRNTQIEEHVKISGIVDYFLIRNGVSTIVCSGAFPRHPAGGWRLRRFPIRMP